jgi:hypothetical protein
MSLDSGWISGTPFTTAKHAFPNPVIAISTSAPLVKQQICLKADSSTCYGLNGASGTCTYAWTADSEWTGSTNVASVCNTYQKTGTHTITLKVTDQDGKTCSTTTMLNVRNNLNVPQWKEISPF